MLTIHDLAFDRIAPLCADLCTADLRELDAAGIEDALAMMSDAVPHCLWAQEARWNDRAVAAFGVRPVPGKPMGIPWMLTTTHMDAAERAAVARAAERAVARMRADFPSLTNWVHAENARAIRFVRWLGFAVDEQLSGRNHAFRRFHWSR